MICPTCGTETPPPLDHCFRCSTPLPEPLSTTPADADVTGAPWTAQVVSSPTRGAAETSPPGQVVAATEVRTAGLQVSEMFGRYRIIKLLGSGGMGQVYQAWDQEIGEAVALKVIRPEFARNPDADARFKRELSVARQVTHKNVVRIHDLGQVGDIKFISMSFIDGIDLATMISREKLPFDLAVSIVRQVCEGLAAAHQADVAHRDFKPANIMVDRSGQAYLMDFGVARCVDTTQYTASGVLIGTVEYMSPEQARGEPADQRSDIYALGIILFELFTGASPFKGDTAMSRLSERLHKPAPDPRTTNPELPSYLANVILRCLERDPALRYQRVEEILADLDTHQTTRLPWRMVWRQWTSWKTATAAVVLLAALGAGLAVRRITLATPARPAGAPSAQSVSLAILPFRNASGDRALDWLGSTLAELLRNAIGQSASLHTVSSDRLNQILRDLHIAPDANPDPATFRRIAEFSNAQTLISGQYARNGTRIQVDATLQDLKRDRSVPVRVEASSESDVLHVIDELAKTVQRNLASSPDVLKELRTSAFRPSSTSIQALRFYNEGRQLVREGNNLDALKRFEASVKEDSSFALAYAELGQTYANLGYDNEAQQNSRKAVDLAEKLATPEKYLARAIHAKALHDNRTALESYENLVKALPDDVDIRFNLAGLYEVTGAFDKARDQYSWVVARDPKHVDALTAMGRVEIRRQNPQGAVDYLNQALSLAIQLENDEARATILQAIGVAYKRLNKPADALRYYEQSLEIKRRIGQKRGIAVSLNEIAQVKNRLGQSDEAFKANSEALQVQREIGDKQGIANTLIDMGTFYRGRAKYDEALKLFRESLQIQRDVGNQSYEALCLNNIGNAYFSKGQYEDALTYFERALQIREKLNVPGDVAQTLYNSAEVLSAMGQYDQVLQYHLRAIEIWRGNSDRRGVAQASYAMGTAFAFQGRYGAALSAKAEALKIFRELPDQFWLAEVLSGYGNTLDEIGRAEEAQKNLAEALALARGLKNPVLIARILGLQGDDAYYRGDYRSARAFFEQALETAAPTTDQQAMVIAKVNMAKVGVKQGRPDSTAVLTRLANEADAAGLRYLSSECLLLAAEALVNAKAYDRARQGVERALGQIERMGLRALQARAHYLLGTALGSGANHVEASRHYAEARRLLDEIRREAGSDDLVKRSDLSPIAAAPAT